MYYYFDEKNHFNRVCVIDGIRTRTAGTTNQRADRYTTITVLPTGVEPAPWI